MEIKNNEIRIVKNGSTQPFITISKLPKGVQLFTEKNAVSMMSPDWRRELIDLASINGEAKPTRSFFKEIMDGFSEGAKMRQMGEAPSYVLCTAQEEAQKISLRSHFPGDILVLDLEETGPVLTQRGAFLGAFCGIGTDIDVVEDVRIAKYSGIGTFMQRIYPREPQTIDEKEIPQMCFLEVHGDYIEVPLYAGESVKAMPGTFVAMTENIQLDVVKVDDLELRSFEEVDYMLQFTAPGESGSKEIVGKVWFHSMVPSEFRKILDHK